MTPMIPQKMYEDMMMIVMVKGMMTLVVVNYEGCHLVVGEKRVPVFINAEVHNIAPLYFDINN